jgi:hypothetical protein
MAGTVNKMSKVGAGTDKKHSKTRVYAPVLIPHSRTRLSAAAIAKIAESFKKK